MNIFLIENYDKVNHTVPLIFIKLRNHTVRLSELYEVSADYLLGINTAYAGSTDLSQQYTEGRSLHDLLYEMQTLNKEQRKSLSQFVRFLKEQ